MASAEVEKESAVVARPKQWWATTKEFFRDTNAEMKKVTWPTKNEVVGTTTVVIVATIVFALFLWGCDELFGRGVLWLLTRFGSNT
jgi:preprotein translocase subunit SecE